MKIDKKIEVKPFRRRRVRRIFFSPHEVPPATIDFCSGSYWETETYVSYRQKQGGATRSYNSVIHNVDDNLLILLSLSTLPKIYKEYMYILRFNTLIGIKFHGLSYCRTKPLRQILYDWGGATNIIYNVYNSNIKKLSQIRGKSMFFHLHKIFIRSTQNQFFVNHYFSMIYSFTLVAPPIFAATNIIYFVSETPNFLQALALQKLCTYVRNLEEYLKDIYIIIVLYYNDVIKKASGKCIKLIKTKEIGDIEPQSIKYLIQRYTSQS